MTTSLIHFDEKYIFVAQVAMANDRVLEGIIHNLATPPITEPYGYLQEKKWLVTNFKKLPLDTTNVVKAYYAQPFILRLTGGILMLDKSQNLVYVRSLLHLVDFKECGKLSWRPIGNCVRGRNWIRCQSMVVYFCCSRGPGGNYCFYIPIILDQSENVRRKGVVDSVRSDGNARIKLGVAAVRIEGEFGRPFGTRCRSLFGANSNGTLKTGGYILSSFRKNSQLA
ncbi:hypothetical protein GOBAR_AA04952 [Gossypium barbadense]|uniref:Uncharacterized protein n=1 Tax=Gossypium barbadense TaxID=3634 RepID=A0A2P5YJ45_GOSBA|nr:hypothetical protein GOBAR_AA04952 [Gossypium barbadense]